MGIYGGRQAGAGRVLCLLARRVVVLFAAAGEAHVLVSGRQVQTAHSSETDRQDIRHSINKKRRSAYMREKGSTTH